MEDIINPCHRLIQRFLMDTIAPDQPDIQVLNIAYVRRVPHQAGDYKTFLNEGISKMTPDKTCCAGNKGFHTYVYCKEGLPIFSRHYPFLTFSLSPRIASTTTALPFGTGSSDQPDHNSP